MAEKRGTIVTAAVVFLIFFIYGFQNFYRNCYFLAAPTELTQGQITRAMRNLWYTVEYQYAVDGVEFEGTAKGVLALGDEGFLDLRYLVKDNSRSIPDKLILPNMLFGLFVTLISLAIPLLYFFYGFRRKLPENDQSRFDEMFRKKPGSSENPPAP